MPGRIDSPQQRHPEPWLSDLNPHPDAGRNFGLQGTHPEKTSYTSVYDLKDAHRRFRHLHDDELKRIPVLPVGARLEANATYVDLQAPQPAELKAVAGMEAGPDNWYVPKAEVDYELWNRLLGIVH